MKKLLQRHIEDILILGGLTLIVTATFLWSFLAGLYCLGGVLFALGVYFARYPLKK